jgi:mannose-6-phosphate isomerase-like protein (cupin superfamily)
MKRSTLRKAQWVGTVGLAFAAGVLVSAPRYDVQPSAIVSQQQAKRENFDWGTLYTYYAGQSYGTKDGLAAVAVIKPGEQIHPPHEHPEEEYLLVLEGEGTWSLKGKETVAHPGDMLYAAPWDIHGVTNTGKTPLKFVVWKWNNNGVALPVKH